MRRYDIKVIRQRGRKYLISKNKTSGVIIFFPYKVAKNGYYGSNLVLTTRVREGLDRSNRCIMMTSRLSHRGVENIQSVITKYRG